MKKKSHRLWFLSHINQCCVSALVLIGIRIQLFAAIRIRKFIHEKFTLCRLYGRLGIRFIYSVKCYQFPCSWIRKRIPSADPGESNLRDPDPQQSLKLFFTADKIVRIKTFDVKTTTFLMIFSRIFFSNIRGPVLLLTPGSWSVFCIRIRPTQWMRIPFGFATLK
jgi:hypothetical protein